MPVLESVKAANEGWSFTTLEQHLTAIILAQSQQLKAIMDERDRTYQQRWESQEKALNTALTAQEKAVAAALMAQKEAVTAAFAAAGKAVDEALTAQQLAVDKAEAATNKRLEGMNEFRQALNDVTTKSIPRIEFDRVVDNINGSRTALIEGLNNRIDELKSYKDTSMGRAIAIGAGFTALVAVIGISLSVMAYLKTN